MSELRKWDESIDVEKHSMNVSSVHCDWKIMQILVFKKWFNNNLIDVVSNLMKADSQIFLLSNFLYKKLQNEDFEKLNRWVKWLLWDCFQWIFVICQGENHWVVIKIDWKNVSILYYDSKAQKKFSHSFYREEMINVSNITWIIAVIC